MAEVAQAWKSVTDIFNDYEGFNPQNRLIEYVNGDDGIPEPRHPFRAVNQDFIAVVARCHDLRPTNMSRAEIVRDEVWMKKEVTVLRAMISAILADFNRSGAMSGPDEADVDWMTPGEQERWVYHAYAKSRRYPGVMSYAYGVLERGTIESLGKDSGKSGRDSSVEGKGTGSSSVANSERKKRKKHRTENATYTEGGGDSIANAITTSSNVEMQFEIIKFKILHGLTEESKQEAFQELTRFQESVKTKNSAVVEVDCTYSSDEDEEGYTEL
jgi:hypothetical protein